MRLAALIVGVIAALLGGLWLVQGLGLVHVQPVLCVAACEAVQGASPSWAAIGAVLAALGVAGIVYGLRGRRRQKP